MKFCTLLAVPDGAYGPKFVNIGKCNGDITTCAPLLRGASIAAHSGEAVLYQPKSYKLRTGCCPLDGFSSLHLKSGSLDNNMSFSSTNATTPGPGTFGTSEIKSPLDGNILVYSTSSKILCCQRGLNLLSKLEEIL